MVSRFILDMFSRFSSSKAPYCAQCQWTDRRPGGDQSRKPVGLIRQTVLKRTDHIDTQKINLQAGKRAATEDTKNIEREDQYDRKKQKEVDNLTEKDKLSRQ